MKKRRNDNLITAKGNREAGEADAERGSAEKEI
jgi:hypothetical protein